MISYEINKGVNRSIEFRGLKPNIFTIWLVVLRHYWWGFQ